MDSSAVATWRILLLGTLYLVAAMWVIYISWMSDITAVKISSCIMVTRRWKWNLRLLTRPGLGDFNDENPLKALICVGRGESLMMKLL